MEDGIMPTTRAKVIHLHEVGGDWPHLGSVPGIKEYWNRALLMGGVVVVHGSPQDAELQAVIEDYRALGVGPEFIIYVPRRTDSLYWDTLSDAPTRRILRQLIHEQGYRLDFFCSSSNAELFVRSFRLDPNDPTSVLNWDRHTVNPSHKLYGLWGDKLAMRRYLRELGLGGMCPVHFEVRTHEELRDRFAQIANSEADGVVCKLGDRASADGMMFFSRGGGDPQRFIDAFFIDPSVGALVEAAWEHIPASVVFNITDGEPEWLYGGVQQVGDVPVGEFVRMDDLIRNNLTHVGNCVCSPGMTLGRVTWELLELAASMMMDAMRAVRDSGYRGRICVDLMVVADTDSSNPLGLKVLRIEKNPRTSHSMYFWDELQALERRFGEQLVVLGCNAPVRSDIRSYEAAKQAVPNFCTGEAGPVGVTFYHVPLIRHGKIGISAKGRSFEEAKEQLAIARAALAPPQ